MDLSSLTEAIRELREQHLTGSQRWIPVKDLERAMISALWDVGQWQKEWKRTRVDPVTKWDLLSDADRDALDLTPLANATACGHCQWIMNTEGEFARHYIVPDLHTPNLGGCWRRLAPEYAGTRPEWPDMHSN